MPDSRFLADALLVVHLLFILGVILPVPLILTGGIAGWRWVRNRTFRFAHLGMIAFVVAETLFGLMCPLTVWENRLRQAAGDGGYGNSFIAYWISRTIYFDLPPWAFTTAYAAFGLLIAGLYFAVPPHARKKAGGLDEGKSRN